MVLTTTTFANNTALPSYFVQVACHQGQTNSLLEVDDAGRFSTSVLGGNFATLDVLTEGNAAVINSLKESKAILKIQHNYQHKYPYDWRTKRPVIIRSVK
jgi:isoleucyl-tRNA synthetase